MRSLPARLVVCASPPARAGRSIPRHPRGRSLDGPDPAGGDTFILADAPRWTISPLPLNAERRLPRSTVLVATATIRGVATEGQIYGRQLQQAGDYTGPHRDPY